MFLGEKKKKKLDERERERERVCECECECVSANRWELSLPSTLSCLLEPQLELKWLIKQTLTHSLKLFVAIVW